MPNSTPITKSRLALVGCGKIAAKHIKAIEQLGDLAECVALCDPNRQAAEALAKGTKARVYEDLNTLLEKENPDLVHILTPSGTHAPLIQQCIGKTRALLVEKPITLKLEDLDSAIKKGKEKGTLLFEVKQNRHIPAIQATKAVIDSGRLGKVFMGNVRLFWSRNEEYYSQASWRGTWSMDGGVFANQGIHHLDLLQWMMGPVKSVFAKTSRYTAKIESEDSGIAIIQFQNGAMASVEATTATRPKDIEGSLSLLGTSGSVLLGGFVANEVIRWDFKEARPEDESIRQNKFDQVVPHAESIKNVLLAMSGKAAPVVDATEARKSLVLLHAIYESAESGKEISLEGFSPRLSRLGAQ